MKLRLLVPLLIAVLFFQPAFGQEAPAHKFLLTGFGFTNMEKEENQGAQYEIGFNPIFLWSINNRILFEGDLEFELEDGGTAVALEYAQILYVFNNYFTFGAGKFLSPNNIFFERLHPAWINKMPTLPLGMTGHGGVQLLATTQLGLQARGGIPAGSSRFAYSLYVSNGPALNVEAEEEGGHEDEGEGEGDGHGSVSANGTLNFDNIPDNNDDKAVGGRISFIPIPELEIGYGIESARVGTDGTPFSDVKSLNNVVDLAFVKDIGALKGRLDFRGQYVWLNVDNPGEHPLEFENNSKAGYAQLAYQPSGASSPFLKNIELVGRYDQLDLPKEAAINIDQKRIALGLNYWLNHSSIFKFAFESVTSEHEDEKETESKFIFQFAMGF